MCLRLTIAMLQKRLLSDDDNVFVEPTVATTDKAFRPNLSVHIGRSGKFNAYGLHRDLRDTVASPVAVIFFHAFCEFSALAKQRLQSPSGLQRVA